MSDNSRAIVPVGQHGVVASVGRRLEITEKLLAESPGKKEYICPITGAKFVLIPAGTFMMGSREVEYKCYEDMTLHQVTISKPFYLQTTPVTQRQWEVVMGNKPSFFTRGGYDFPAEMVSWDATQEFISKLSSQSGKKYRLPTEAEWEYACRAGSTGKYCFGDDETMLGEYAWYGTNSDIGINPVGLKRPNDWGLYDMHGNVWEWVQDWHGLYSRRNVTDPAGPVLGIERVQRGGSGYSDAQESRAASRCWLFPYNEDSGIGFRIAVSPNTFSKSIALDIPDAEDYFNRGWAYYKCCSYQEAINDYNMAIELNPKYAMAYHCRGIAYGDIGNTQQEIKDYDKAIDLNPQYAMTYHCRGNTYEKLGNYQQAINDYNKTIELNPKYAMTYYNRGNTYEKLGNYQQAINDYNKAIELNPQYTDAFNKRGIAYEKLGNTQQAIEDHKIVARLEKIRMYKNLARSGHKYACDYLRAMGIEW